MILFKISLLLIFLSIFLKTPSPKISFTLQTSLIVESRTSELGSFNKLSIIFWNELDLKNYKVRSEPELFSTAVVIHFIILFFIPAALSLSAVLISYPTSSKEKQKQKLFNVENVY